MDQIISIKNVSFSYEGRTILSNICCDVERGNFTGLIGPNGAGKSTMVKLLLNMLSPSVGEVFLFGTDIRRFQDWDKIGYISQNATSFNSSFPASVEEIVKAGLYKQIKKRELNAAQASERVAYALSRVGMLGYRKSLIGALSGGQQQRVFIAKSLVSNPELLILDEPTTGIDAASMETVFCLLSELNKQLGITIFMVTHELESITGHANRIIELKANDLLTHNLDVAQDGSSYLNQDGSLLIRPHICKHCAMNRNRRDFE